MKGSCSPSSLSEADKVLYLREMKCLICNLNEADKTGSHVIPHFILESLQNPLGIKGRDKGLTFGIGESSSDLRFGRKMLPETFESLLGRPVNEEEIKNSIEEQYHVEDFIFCTVCETKLSVFETLYNLDVIQVINENRPLSPNQYTILQFFWLMVIFRCSIAPKSGFKMEHNLQESVRTIINGIMSDKIDELRNRCLTIPFPFALRVYVNTTARDKTRNSVLLHPNYIDPYLLFINEYVLLFNLSHQSQVHALGRLLQIDLTGTRGLDNLAYINNEEWEKVIAYCMGTKAKQFYSTTKRRFRESYYSRKGTMPSATLTMAFMDELTLDDRVDEYVKYSEKRINSLIEKYCI